MVEGRYIYSRDCKWPSEAIDVHHIIVRNSNTKGLFLCLFVLILFANSLYLLLMKVRNLSLSPLQLVFSSLKHAPLDTRRRLLLCACACRLLRETKIFMKLYFNELSCM
uniref:Uncharacterized protein LOC103340315 n=1 Tax=Rhizophora mucronata TaxID=61149 RepID=A0A2P2JNK3_RHIMU